MLSHALRASVNNTTIPPLIDPNFNQVSLLLHGDGTNGAQNNTFIGEVNPAQYYGSFNSATPQYLSVDGSGGQMNFGTGNFTIECYAYLSSTFTGATIAAGIDHGNWMFAISPLAPDTIAFGRSLVAWDLQSTAVLTATNTWYHLAACRSGTTLKLFINGIQVATQTNSNSFTANSTVWAGRRVDGQYLNGRMSNLRVVKGTALYTANFTPPTGNLTAVTGTQLLTLQNATIVDNSTNNFTITNNGTVAMTDQYPVVTRNGNTTQGTNTPFSQAAGYWSNCIVNNNTTSIATPDSSSFILSADFTVEMWLNNPSTAGYIPQVFNIGRGSNSDSPYGSNGIMLQFTGDGVYLNGSNIGINLQSYCNSGQWMHIALCRTGSTFKVFINGNQVYSSTFTAVINSGGKNVLIGSNPSLSSFGWNGYISNLRVVNGTGLYTSNFTPSTTPLTAVTNTVLLTCQSNRFVDNSSNNFAITAPTGTPSVQPFSPFAPTAAYSTSVNGGSMYFDGTGDYLSVVNTSALAFGTGDFTVEVWLYLNSTSDAAYIHGSTGSTGNFGFNLVSSTMLVYTVGGSAVSYSPSLSTNQWTHLAFTRSGTTLTLYKNGVSLGTRSFTNNVTAASGSTVIGAETGSTNFVNGYMADLRMVKGTAVYTANFTPPTAPLTAVTNTSLLLSGTNAGIFDNASKNDLETVGNAQVSTSVVKYGTGSIYFDGVMDYLTFPPTPQVTFGTGNFTIECWINAPATQTSYAGIYCARTGGTCVIQFGNSGNGVEVWFGGQVASSSANLVANGWHHIAFVRLSGVCTIYVDGVAGSFSSTDNTNITTTSALIGVDGYSFPSRIFNGYIDDIRITKGVARYTANFTPPTAAFPNQ